MGEIPIHPVGLRPAAQTLAPRDPPRRQFQGHSVQQENPAVVFLLLLGHDASVDLQRVSRLPVSHTVSALGGLHLRVHSCRQHLHVHLRGAEVVHDLPIRAVQTVAVHIRGPVRDAVQRDHREHRGGVGVVREEAQVLRR